ncbi:Ku protein [Acidicapsa dinghuensis]|uniref:Non-homologous end joining protein Ku n=1 Tax=Acidicapsa dinghuensis TaxID=2218256 RepID=A0ABW1EHD4_9BACT|nr:Ku protein [Acidicapsa dinghuensis]
MARPFWSGRLQISLVSFGIKIFPATEAKSEIRFHQIHRKSGERVHHRNVTGSDGEPIEKDEIVKGYEYSKGKYVALEPDELEKVRIPSKQTLEIAQFVAMQELDPAMLERPYFILPEDDAQAEAFAVVRKALQQTGKVGLGKIAFGGREHLMAVAVPSDESLAGLMGYTMRYGAELRDAMQYFGEIKKVSVDAEQLSLAKELIQRKTAKFNPSRFKDEYEVALRALIDAKLKHKPLPKEERPASTRAVNLMDALRRSVTEKKPPAKARRSESKSHGIALVKSAKRASRSRKSA